MQKRIEKEGLRAEMGMAGRMYCRGPCGFRGILLVSMVELAMPYLSEMSAAAVRDLSIILPSQETLYIYT